MGATPVYALSWPNPPDPADGPAAFQDLAQDTEAALLTVARVPIVSALPGSPVDGQMIYYQNAAMAALGIVWQLRYRAGASGSYKWEFVGGPPITAAVATQESTTNAAYVALTTAGPAITLPLAGDYDVTLNARAFNITNACGGFMSYDDAAAAVDANALEGFNQSSPSVAHGFKLNRRTGMAAGQVLTCKYRRNVGGEAVFSDRRISATPVRVG
jgi:hypothetical protein